MSNTPQKPKSARKSKPSVHTGAGDTNRPPISTNEQIRLWVRSGGRCVYCGEYLLDRYLGGEPFAYDIHTGEMAHIVGWKDSKRSPRGQHPLAMGERNKADNLMLLCPTHHTLIDKKILENDFTVERLRQDKQDHEARIQHLTSLGRDRETSVVRMIGGVRGAAVELSIETAQNSVYQEEGRYAVFPFIGHRHELEIALVNLPDPEQEWHLYWQMGCKIIDQRIERVNALVREGEVRHVSVFGFARIPLLVYLGFQIDDKIPSSVYQKQRGGDEGWNWPDDQAIVAFEGRAVQSSPDIEKLALILSVSGSIPLTDVLASIDGTYNVYEIRPVGIDPGPDLFRSKATLEAFASCYRNMLSQFEVAHKPARQIHLFPAVPLSAAVVCGRTVMRHAQPELVVYDRTSDRSFRPALTVNA